MPRSSAAAEAAASQTPRFLTFEVGDRGFALPLSQVREVLPMAVLADAPGLPPFVQGLLDLGAAEPPLPVLRLDRLFPGPEAPGLPGLHTPIVVVTAPGAPAVGILTSRVQGISAAPARPLRRADETFNGCAVGILTADEAAQRGEVAVLEAGNLLLAEEQERLARFAEEAARRRQAVQETPPDAPDAGTAGEQHP